MIITKQSKDLKSMYLNVEGMDMLPVKILGDYRENGTSGFVDLGTFSSDEIKEFTKAGIDIVNSKFDGWNNPSACEAPQGHACSCCIKKLDKGNVIMGRNMDLPIGFAPMILFRTQGNGVDTYDTVNLGYSSPGEITFDQVAELGAIPQPLFTGMSVVVCDVLNSEGLYLQYDMRESTDCPTKSTNPNSPFRTATITLIRLLGDHCKTIDEALDYLKTLDIYDAKAEAFDWSMAIGIMDKTGRYGVIEFVNNKIVWNEGRPGFACGQCNFYWDKEGSKTQWNQGYGRWLTLMGHYNDINNLDDMQKAMESIWYSNFFTDGSLVKDWKVNWMSEMSDKVHFSIRDKWIQCILNWKDEYGITVDEKELEKVKEIAARQADKDYRWSNDYLDDPANYYEAITVVDLFIKSFRQIPLEAKKMSGYMEASTISYVADNQNLGYRLRVFETNDVFHVGLKETKIERIPTTKIHGTY